jgi:uncharacterized membrane protein
MTQLNSRRTVAGGGGALRGGRGWDQTRIVATGRLEAFSDGVMAILITIMVLELHIPEETDLAALRPLVPVLLAYILSFVILGIYWSNHHHLLRATKAISGGVLWANLHLLFWLSLFPFVSGWMGEHHFENLPTSVYGVVMLGAAMAYFVLQRTIIRVEGTDSPLRAALGRDVKGRVSPALYAGGAACALANRWIAISCYVAVAVVWLVPDRRLETRFDLLE